jgi:hypothetical protein
MVVLGLILFVLSGILAQAPEDGLTSVSNYNNWFAHSFTKDTRTREFTVNATTVMNLKLIEAYGGCSIIVIDNDKERLNTLNTLNTGLVSLSLHPGLHKIAITVDAEEWYSDLAIVLTRIEHAQSKSTLNTKVRDVRRKSTSRNPRFEKPHFEKPIVPAPPRTHRRRRGRVAKKPTSPARISYE